MKAVTGRSLKEENDELWKGVDVQLFPLRNRLAHRGEIPSKEDAEAAVRTAAKAIAWLKTVVAGEGVAVPPTPEPC